MASIDSSGGEVVEELGESVHTQRADVGGCRAVVVDEHEGRLRGDFVVGPQRPVVVVDGVLERSDVEGVDEVVDRRKVIPAGYADEGDRVTVLLVYRCDRRGFCSARWSPWRPEPQDRVGAFESVEVDLTTGGGLADQRDLVVGGLRAAGCGHDRQDRHHQPESERSHPLEASRSGRKYYVMS